MLSLDASLYGDLSAHLQSKEKSKSEGFGVAKRNFNICRQNERKYK